jgi:hypothetical protein
MSEKDLKAPKLLEREQFKVGWCHLNPVLKARWGGATCIQCQHAFNS